MPIKHHIMREFHVSRVARDKYQFDQSLFSLHGNVIFANFHAARIFTDKINQKRDVLFYPEQSLQAGQFNALGLIDEIMHFVIATYLDLNPGVITQALDLLVDKIGAAQVAEVLRKFTKTFPPLAVYRGELDLDNYFYGTSAGISNREIILEELMMLWLTNSNPACNPFLELFDDNVLKNDTLYSQVIDELRTFFDTQSPFGPENQNLIEMLRSPALEVPYSLSGQLEYIRTHWDYLLGQYMSRILRSSDLINEEEKAVFLGPGPALVYDYSQLEAEPEQFSPDKDWMPSLVLIAKNAYVWLDQLSKKYQRPITKLDQIPDEDLDVLSDWGFSGLWLIGLWERSPASKRIKQMRGNPEAVASAYSLLSYDIANDLGGEEAYHSLRDRAWQRGIRLASDMVPNHMGIDSRWIMEHPDWFINLDYSPYPSYRFTGANLSWDERIGIYLEDHYYDNTDAAVVFKRVDLWTGEEKYIYHGNDGTSMPWNDTAQLDYLKNDVKEAVIQTILQVARKFPIIRFDAAMTLAKKHFQRLWYPEPGTGGAIPSRADQSITKAEFDIAFPVEFWREVVDRVAQEVPDTLLLAEAFWLMEGYFVRTLGMHRVYNSAFMNMLRDEKNQEYRLVIKNTLEFDPEILKRYVNFMNNPDERTAVDQFGKGDKYFGICAMMSTMPGLPMFGHGQVEGYTEKYGMEYRKAYWDEQADNFLVNRHKQIIFPLLKLRYLFAEVKDFRFYDFFANDGSVNEDVFAYSNRSGDERALIIYNNRYAHTSGWIHTSAAFSVKTNQGELQGDPSERKLIQKSLADGLGINAEPGSFTIFRDHISNLEYIRSNQEITRQGLHIDLDAYKTYVFIEFREVISDQTNPYAELNTYLDGRGVSSIQKALNELLLKPIQSPYHEFVNAAHFRWVIENSKGSLPESRKAVLLEEINEKIYTLCNETRVFIKSDRDIVQLIDEIKSEFKTIMELSAFTSLPPSIKLEQTGKINEYLFGSESQPTGLANKETKDWSVILSLLATYKLGKIATEENYLALGRSWLDEWMFTKIIESTFHDLGIGKVETDQAIGLLKALTAHADWYQTISSNNGQPYRLLEQWLKESDIQRLIGINRYEGVLWFNREAFELFLWWMFLVAVIQIISQAGKKDIPIEQISICYKVIQKMITAEKSSEYQVEKLLDSVRKTK